VFDQLGDLAATGSTVGMNVVAVANRWADLGALTRLTGDRLIGAVSEPEDRTRLGAPTSGPADRHVGRCWSTESDRRVQLAVAPSSIEHEVAMVAPEHARVRPPKVFVTGASS
jgi:S-DNA-T family DNA segregation ATPase FtsK/SpoIIIE